MSEDRESQEEVFFCRVDNFLATKDYLEDEHLCVRMLGVIESDFSKEALKDGVTTFTIDLDHCELCKLEPWAQDVLRICKNIQNGNEVNEVEEFHEQWYQLVIIVSYCGSSYLYKTFSEVSPIRFEIRSLSPIQNGPDLSPVAPVTEFTQPLSHPKGYGIDTSVDQNIFPTPLNFAFSQGDLSIQQASSSSFGGSFRFDAFHVGQGMCSLVTDDQDGYLLDAGAGKPITRSAYIQKSINNDLRTEVNKLTSLQAVISHADSDHWRILAWDSLLLSKVNAIYFPANANSLVLKDKAIKAKALGLNDYTWKLAAGTKLMCLRSAPSKRDSNGNCLVTIFERNNSLVLAAGDYVYDRFATDGNRNINNLLKARFSAVVVPHHGDAASANSVVKPTKQGTDKAFFSAGTHMSYNHPTQASLDAHTAAGYNNINNPTNPHIELKNLI